MGRASSKQYITHARGRHSSQGRGAQWDTTRRGMIRPSRVSNETYCRLTYYVIGAAWGCRIYTTSSLYLVVYMCLLVFPQTTKLFFTTKKAGSPGGSVVPSNATSRCWSSNPMWVGFFSKICKIYKRRIGCWRRLLLVAWVGAIRCESTREGKVEVFSWYNFMQGTNCRGEERKEPTLWPRIWVTTRKEREKKGEENKWDGKKRRRKNTYKYFMVCQAKLKVDNNKSVSVHEKKLRSKRKYRTCLYGIVYR